jgi:hypothetical protein
MKDIKDIERLVAEINRSAEGIRKGSKRIKEISDDQLPSNFSIMLSGITDSKAIRNIFSSRLDVLIDNLMNLALSGDVMRNIEKFITNEEELRRFIDSLGFGEGSFKGPVSTTIMSTVRDSIESSDYMRLDSDAKKIAFVYKKLRMKWWSFWNKPDLRKKYSEALVSIRKILEVVARVYSNREKIVKGLGNIVNESQHLDRITF